MAIRSFPKTTQWWMYPLHHPFQSDEPLHHNGLQEWLVQGQEVREHVVQMIAPIHDSQDDRVYGVEFNLYGTESIVLQGELSS